MIAEILTWVAYFVAAMALQTSLMPSIAVFGITPDLLMIALFVLAMRYGIMPGIFVGFFIGLSQDLYSTTVLGQHALAATLAGFFVGIFNERVMRTDPMVRIVIFLLAFVVHDAVYIAVEILRGGSPVGATMLWLVTRTAPRAAYSVVLVLLFYLWQIYVRAPRLRR
jgi:rod shape-determining protein MreD